MKNLPFFRRILALMLLTVFSAISWADDAYDLNGGNILLIHDHIRYVLNTQTKEAMVGDGLDYEQNALEPPKYGDADYGTNYWRDLVIPSEISYNQETYSVTSIAWRAFARTTYIHNITLPETLSSINSEAFYMCTELESVTIPDGVTSIGSEAFMLCRSLKYAHLPSCLTEIKEKTFSDCYTLEEINIPGACTRVGIDAFTACKQLSKLRIDDGIGLLTFTYSEAVPVNYQAITEDKDDLLPHIRGQFADCPLDNLYLGRNVCFPREYYLRAGKMKTLLPFERCSEYRIQNLKSQRYLFFSPTFEKVEFGDYVTNIPDSLFCRISSDPFMGGGIKNEIILPKNLTTIGHSAFKNAIGRTSRLLIPDDVATISSYAFYSGGIQKLTLPKNSNLTIEELAFSSNQIDTLIIPNNIISIGRYAFTNNAITNLVLPNKEFPIGINAFSGNSIENLMIPEKLTRIDGFAFNKIREITIPASVTQIATGAFSDNPLRNVFCNTETPPSESNPFLGAAIYVPTGKGSVYRQQWSDALIVDDSDDIISVNVKTAGTLYSRLLAQDYQTGDVCKLKLKGTLNDDDLTIINDMSNLYYLDLSEMQVGEVLDGLFQNTPRLVTVKLPNSLTSIHDDEFIGCNNLTGDMQIPALCTSIGKNAFANTAIKSLTYSGVIVIDSSAFENCYLLHDLDIIPGTTIGESAFQGTQIKRVTISSGVSVGENAFKDTGLKEVLIESDVNEIGDGAFGANLEKITFKGPVNSIGDVFSKNLLEVHACDIDTWCQLPFVNEGPMKYSPRLYIGEEEVTDVVVPNTVSNLRDYAFLNCNSLTSVTLSPGVKSIGNEAFNNCGNLTSAALPVTLTEIGDKAFQNCGELVTVQLPSKLTSIGEFAFSGCAKLVSMTMPVGIDVVHENTFKDCTALASLSLPATLTSIKQNAFSGCSSLIKLDLPSSITSIEQYAFENCSALQKVAVHWDNPITITNVFSSIPSNCYLYCPIGTSTKYFNAGWNVFSNLKESGILSITTNIGGVVSCYDENISNRSEDIYFTPYKSFNVTIEPNTGYNIMKLRLNNEDVLSELENGTLFIEEPEENMNLSVTFADDNIVLYDANGDGEINSLDAISVAKDILKNTPEKFYEYAADVNDDGVINITDAAIIISNSLSK